MKIALTSYSGTAGEYLLEVWGESPYDEFEFEDNKNNSNEDSER